MQIVESDWKLTDPVWTILASAPSMLAYWDKNLECRFANQAYERRFGVTGASLVGTLLWDLLGPDLFAANEPHVRGVLEGRAQHFERTLPGPGGARCVIRAAYLPHCVGGEVAGFVVEVNDVSDLCEAREDLARQVALCRESNALLKKSEAALKEAQRLAATGSWYWEIEADIVTWSHQLYELFGLDPALLPPSYAAHRTLFPEASWERLQEAVARALTFGEPYVLELEYFHSSGRRGWVETRCSIERDDEGKVVALLGTLREISARHPETLRMARRIEDLEAALETQMRHNRTLQAACDKARGLEVVGSQAVSIAHDFNHILSALAGSLQLMELTTTEARSRSLAERGQRAVDHATDLVRQFMDTVKTCLPQVQVVELGDLLRRRLHFFQVAAASRVRVVLKADIVARVLVDAGQLEAALLELIANARNAMPDGGTLTLRLIAPGSDPRQCVTGEPARVAIQVQDTGMGMSRELRERVQEPGRGVGGQGGGRVPGLSMVHGFARTAGGRLFIESRPGHGTAVTILLPRIELTVDGDFDAAGGWPAVDSP